MMKYAFDDTEFCETLTFPVELAPSPSRDVLCSLLTAVAGVSYAKAFAPVEVDASACAFTPQEWAVVEAVYSAGMAEFAFHQAMKMPFTVRRGQTVASYADDSHAPARVATRPEVSRPVIPLGAGRDSCVVATALAPLSPMLLSVGGSKAAHEVADALAMPLNVVVRTLDPQLFALNAQGAPNGHVPVTAINSLISLVYAVAIEADAVVMANENSASVPTRVVDGVPINHQFSKSAEFEILLSDALSSRAVPARYFSAIRDRTDDDISRVFASRCSSLHRHFVSCNRAGLIDQARRSERWCGECAKCRSVFLSLAPYLDPHEMVGIFGADLLADPTQVESFNELFDDETKPFECVQTVDEARSALERLLASEQWSSHVVVRTLAARRLNRQHGNVSGSAPRTEATRTETTHTQQLIPEPYATIMNSFFDVDPSTSRGSVR